MRRKVLGQLLYRTIWLFVFGVPMTTIGIAQAFDGEIDLLGLGWAWYVWVIIGLLLIIAGLVWHATKWIAELSNELVEVDVKIETDSELYLGRPIVYLLIVNKEEFDIKDCYANLSVLKYKQPHLENERGIFGTEFRWVNALVWINLNRHKLRWPAFPIGSEKIVRSGQENKARVDIATTENGKPVFIFETENNPTYETFLNYYLEVEFGGYANGKQVRRVRFCGNIRFDFEGDKANVYLHPGDCHA